MKFRLAETNKSPEQLNKTSKGIGLCLMLLIAGFLTYWNNTLSE